MESREDVPQSYRPRVGARLAATELAWRRKFWTPTLAALGALNARYQQVALHTALLVLGLIVQGVLILTVAHLVDLAVSLMELWAELARKHLEITLSP